ncbi:hypothetical protein ACIBEJ_28095 [Nonomuraea sp. NPDC050790]|uniref:hypothetical protein n=1 Tax=Nonomuraea sp. NPDC050790 TaxID=3364371 RepID=UPI00379CB155
MVVSRRAALAALLVVVPVGCAREPAGRTPRDGVDRADLSLRARRAAERVAAVLGHPVRPSVEVAADAAQAARTAGTASAEGLAALAHDGRVIVIPENYARLTPTGRDVVLAHELTHVAAGTGGLPAWLYEGFADYVAYKDAALAVPVAAAELAAEVRAGRVPRELPGAGAFAPGAARLAQSYQEAWLACRFLAARFGEDRLVRFYRDARRLGVERALPLPARELAAGWRAYLRKELE